MQVRKIKERKAEKRTISSSSSSAGSRSPERNSEGDGAKKQVGTKKGFGRRRAGEFTVSPEPYFNTLYAL